MICWWIRGEMFWVFRYLNMSSVCHYRMDGKYHLKLQKRFSLVTLKTMLCLLMFTAGPEKSDANLIYDLFKTFFFFSWNFYDLMFIFGVSKLQYLGVDCCMGAIKWEISTFRSRLLSSIFLLIFFCFSYFSEIPILYLLYWYLCLIALFFIFFIYLTSCSIFCMIFSKLFSNFIDIFPQSFSSNCPSP